MKYRIKKDKDNYFICQYKYWLLPFWFNFPEPSHHSFEAAKLSWDNYIEDKQRRKKNKEQIVWHSDNDKIY